MSVGLGLLHKLILSKTSLAYLSESGVDGNSFVGDERKAFKFIQEYFNSYSDLPKIETIEKTTKVKFSSFPNEPIAYWTDRLKRRNIGNDLIKGSRKIQSAIAEGDIEKAKEEAAFLFSDLQRKDPTGGIYELSNLADNVVSLHDDRQKSGVMRGIPFGIDYLDSVSDGAQPGDAIALCGRPSLGKSFLLLMMALKAYDAGKTPLVLSMEMSAVQCARRILALRARVPSTSIRLGRLSYWARDKLVSNIGNLKQMSGRPFPIIQGGLKTTIEDMIPRIQEIKPAVLYVDGGYLLRTRIRTNSRWERVTETAEILKTFANHFAIPVITTYQFNRQGAGSLANIGMSDAIGQLASIVLSIDDDDDNSAGEMPEFASSQFKILELLKGREGERGVIRLTYNLQKMIIKQESVIRGDQIEQL